MDSFHRIIININTLVHLIKYTRRREKFMKLTRLSVTLHLRNLRKQCYIFASIPHLKIPMH
jgi:hypothetical protein